MRAQFIRGLDPKEAMGTGNIELSKIIQQIADLKWQLKYQGDELLQEEKIHIIDRLLKLKRRKLDLEK